MIARPAGDLLREGIHSGSADQILSSMAYALLYLPPKTEAGDGE